MNELAAMLVDGLLALEESVGATVTWAGTEWPCVGGSELKGKRLELGGWQSQADCVVVLRAAVFGDGARPAAKQLLSYASAAGSTATTWRIDAVRTIYDQVLVLECNDPTGGGR